ncbi:MAG: hypothetical protein ACOX2P_00620 [Bacillota bacterium]|jgi:hypothetical protein
MEKRHLYIVLTRTNTVMSKLIHIFTNDKYTHAAISLDKELNQMYSFGRRSTYNPFIGRFRKEDINEGVYKLCNPLPGAIIEVEVTREQYDEAKKLLDHFIINSHLYKYNYWGILHSFLNKPACSDYSFLCSEFVYHILKESGAADLKISRNLVRPQSLLNIEGRIIYQGNLKAIKPPKNRLSQKEIWTRRLRAIYGQI